MKTGLVLGKFYPPTLGHKYLIDTALQAVDKVLVVVGDVPTEGIPGYQRVLWLQEMFPTERVEVINISNNNPPDVAENSDTFWDIWIKNLRDNLPYIPDVIIASEDYGGTLASMLGIESLKINRKHRERLSATMVRNNPRKMWDFIPEVVKPYFDELDIKVFVISDTHFNHENIKKYEGRPDDFNEIIINNWNAVVRPQDIVIHLGDVIFGSEKDIKLRVILNRLNGKKILCRGNHDEHDDLWYYHKGFDMVCDYFVYKDIAFSHPPITPLPTQGLKNHSTPVRLNIHGHFHRGKHRVPADGDTRFRDDFYDYPYYKAHESAYKLIQIEDELRPFTLEEICNR